MKNKNIPKKMAASTMALCLLVSTCPLPVLALTKEETVITKLNYDGTQKNILVNERLLNSKKTDKLDDYSELENILNINNDDKYIANGRNLTWNTDGRDVFYQGTTNKELPIKLKIKYSLDGKDMTVDEMLGKSGKVSIELKYENSDKHYVKVNGTSTILYTPFTVTLGTILDSNVNTNVKISNGKIVSNGTSNIVVGLAMPGLYESLNNSKLKGSDEVTIEFETTKFELPSIYSVVTPKLVDSSDLTIFDELDSLYSKVDSLGDNMDKIEDGSKSLKAGSNELKTKLAASISSMSSSQGDALTEEQIESIKNSTVATVKSTFTEEYRTLLKDTAWKQVQEGMNPNDPKVVASVTNSVSKAVVDYLNTVGEYQDYVACETGKAILTNGGAMSSEQQNSCVIIQNDTTLPLIQKAATTAAKDTASNVSSYVAEKVSKEVAVSVAEQTSEQVATTLTGTLAPQVANQVKNASISTISGSLNTLYKGVETLDEGINSLTDGIKEFNEKGISKLTNTVNTEVKGSSSKMKALTKLADNYQSFGSKSDKTRGETKFVMIVDSKKVPKEKIKTTTSQSKTTFFDRIKNLFN